MYGTYSLVCGMVGYGNTISVTVRRKKIQSQALRKNDTNEGVAQIREGSSSYPSDFYS